MAKPEDRLATLLANMPEKTGKSLDEWLKIVREKGFRKHGEIVAFVKSEYGVGHGYANQIANQALSGGGSGAATEGGAGGAGAEAATAGSTGGGAGADLVAQQYAGGKAALLPVYEALVKAVEGFGSDVELSPKKAYVSLRRSKQFGILQPSTATRLDVGLNLPKVPAAGRLEASGSFNSMVSHRVRVASAADVDKELVGWLKQAYDGA